MKSILIASWLFLASLSLYAQAPAPAETTLPVDTETNRVSYSGVVAVKGANQNELYTRAKLWLALTYDEAKEVIKVDEKDAGLLVIRAYTDIPVRLVQKSPPVSREVGYTMILNFKDGRYRYTLTNYQLLTLGTATALEQEIIAQLKQPNKTKGTYAAQQYAESIKSFATRVAESLEGTLQKPVSGEYEW